jgi:hypothetical protein
MISAINKIALFVLFLFISINSNAQPVPGTTILKGSSALTGQFLKSEYNNGIQTSQEKTTQINFQPSIGIFITHFVNIGINAAYSYNKDQEENTYYKSTMYAIGPYIRGYFTDAKFAPFLNGDVGISRSKIAQKLEGDGYEKAIAMNGINCSIGIGMEYFVSPAFSFEFLLAYAYSSVSPLGSAGNTGNIKSKGLEFRIGASILFGKKSKSAPIPFY